MASPFYITLPFFMGLIEVNWYIELFCSAISITVPDLVLPSESLKPAAKNLEYREYEDYWQ